MESEILILLLGNTSYIHFKISKRSYRCTSRELLLNKQLASPDRFEFLGETESELLMDIDLSVGRSSCSRSFNRDERINCLLDTFSSVVVGCRYKSTERVIYTVIWDCRDSAACSEGRLTAGLTRLWPKIVHVSTGWWTQFLYLGFGSNVKIRRSKRESEEMIQEIL